VRGAAGRAPINGRRGAPPSNRPSSLRIPNLSARTYQWVPKSARTVADLADAERLVRAGEVAWEDVDATWREVRATPTGWLRHEPDEVEAGLLARRAPPPPRDPALTIRSP
jgi:hypothetical protein